MEKIRRIAANRIVCQYQSLSPGVIELLSGKVLRMYPLQEEISQTEWLGGTIEIRTDEQGILRAYQNNQLLC